MYAESGKNTGRTSTNETRCSSPALSRCANCDIEFPWSPIVVRGISYCCTGCAAGGPCNCDYSQYRAVNVAGVIHYDWQENDVSRAHAQPEEKREQQ